MKLQIFFDKFDQFADAPNAVTKMRELVLQLAVQGRLVKQRTDEQSAATLAVQIAEDRAAFVKARSLTRQQVFDSVAGDQRPFFLPRGWVWTRLGNLCRVQAGFAFDSAAFTQSDSGMPIIRIRDITKDHTQVNYVGEFREEFLVDAGDYLVGMDGNFTIAQWRGPRALLNQRVSRLQWYSQHLKPSFFAIAAQHRLSELQGTKAYTTVDHLSSSQIENSVVPLPPLTEQKRIVAKVDELMALCDRLEEQQQERESQRAVLTSASMARFADAPTPANLPLLFHPSCPIPPAKLRKSILTLAVHGKLVRFEVENDPQTVGDHVTFQNGYAFKSQWFKPAGIRLCRNVNVSHGVVDWRESAFVDDDVAKEFERFALSEGDIVLSLDRPLITTGLKVARIRKSDLPCLLLQRVAKPVPKHDQLDMSYFFLWLNSSEFVDSIDPGRSNGVPHISTRHVQLLPFVLPRLAEQRRIVAKVDLLMALVDQLEVQLTASRATAANLLSALVAELAQNNKRRGDET